MRWWERLKRCPAGSYEDIMCTRRQGHKMPHHAAGRYGNDIDGTSYSVYWEKAPSVHWEK